MKKILTKTTAFLMASCAWTGAMAADGIEVNHLTGNNTMVRVTGNAKYVILPVEESIDDDKVDVLIDGKLDQTIMVRLAKSKVDYYVPFDIEKYSGKNIILNVVSSQSRSGQRVAKDDACWNNISLADNFDVTNREKFRPKYHHTPLYGWMNDPNGMVYVDGLWHLAFQWNPYGSKWQNMNWGQSVSRDLIHWESQIAPIIEPDGLGTVFSGSAAIDKNNSAGFGKDAVLAMYTSAGPSQVQSLAWSNDGGMTYDIYPGNPTLTLNSEARDPNMFWNEERNEWNLILAHPLEREYLLFSSPDMKNWTLNSAFGKGLGSPEGIWECPDLFQLPVRGTDQKKWVIICNINPGGPFGGSSTQYFVGDFDGKTFTPDRDANGNVITKWLDYGKDNYAGVSFSDAPDGRRVLVGWMSNWQYAGDVPTQQFRSANTLPRDLDLFQGADGQLYVASTPSPEVEQLRDAVVKSVANASINNKGKIYNLPTSNNGICEIVAEFDAVKSKNVSLTIANDKNETVVMTYDVASNKLSFDRRKSGIVDFNQEFPCITTTPTFSPDGKLSLRIFIDTSSIEVFEKTGKFIMTNLVFPNSPYSTLTIKSEGGNAKMTNLKIYSIKL